MANYGKRVSIFSYSGEDPVLDLSDREFRTLEEIYGYALSEAAREGLISHAQNYFHWRIAELNSDPLQEVKRLLEKVTDSVSGFQQLAYGELIPGTDAGKVAESAIAAQLDKLRIALDEEQLILFDQSSREEKEKRVDLGGLSLAIAPDFRLLMNVSISLSLALSRVEKEIASQEADKNRQGFVPGQAFPSWLLAMRGWAIENQYRFGPFTAVGAPSKFSQFLFALNGYFGTHARGEEWKLRDLKDSVASVEALADRLKKLSRTTTKNAQSA